MAKSKSTGALFPLINAMKEQNGEVDTKSDTKLKRAPQKQDNVRMGDGLAAIMAKVWNILKKQEEAYKKEFAEQSKFRKESINLTKKNHEIILKSLECLNKDTKGVLTKILDLQKKSVKEEEKRWEEERRQKELANDFSKEIEKEKETAESKRHKELLKALAGMGGSMDVGKTKKEKEKGLFGLLMGLLGTGIKKLLGGVLESVLGKSFARFLITTLPDLIKTAVSSVFKTLPTIIETAVNMAKSNPITTASMAGIMATAMAMAPKINAAAEASKKGDVDAIQTNLRSSMRIQQGAGGEFAPQEDIDEAVVDETRRLLELQASQGNQAAIDALKRIEAAKKSMSGREIKSPAYSGQGNAAEVRSGAAATRLQKKAGAENPNIKAKVGTEKLEQGLSQNIPGFTRVTADTGGQHVKGSKHYEGLAVDFTVAGGKAAYKKAYAQTIAYLKSTGLTPDKDFTVLDEANNKIPGVTEGDHIHVQFNSPEAANKFAQASTTTTLAATTATPVSDDMESLKQSALAQLDRDSSGNDTEKPQGLKGLITAGLATAAAEIQSAKELFSDPKASVNLSEVVKDNKQLDKVALGTTVNNIVKNTNNAFGGGSGEGSQMAEARPRNPALYDILYGIGMA
jgi:hypothetical protein